MNNKFLKAVLVLIIAIQFSFAAEKNSTDTPFKIAFGSCGKQDHPLPVFKEVIKQKPNLFIFLGDNIYGDTHDMELLRNKYKQLGSKESYQHLIKNTEVLATWDDHDYGRNDAGKNYPQKQASKQIFLDFFAALVLLFFSAVICLLRNRLFSECRPEL